MRYEALYDGKKVPVLGLGTWRIGGGEWEDGSRDRECIDAMRKALGLGYTLIDTAEMYAGGHTEELVGKAIEGFEREKLFITSKVWSSNLRYEDLLRAFEGSLRRMKMDYIDLYLIHWPNPDIPMKETFDAMNELSGEKRARYVGVSNFSVEQMREAAVLSSVPLVTNQVKYNVLYREPEYDGVLDYCRKKGMLLTAWKPLDRQGVLSNPVLQEIASKYGATAAQVSIAWLVRQRGVITIPMSMQERHLRENLEAVDLDIRDDGLKILENLR